jgi:endonuclease/exonuclease/phosphatase family metal-dependent hydrolase
MIKASALIIVAALSIFRFAGYFNEPRLTDAEIHAIAGEPAGVASAGVRGGRPLTVVSWNIERGVQFQKIVTTLRALEPDVILLQEVDRYCQRSGNRDVARDLGRQLGMNWVHAGEYQEIGEAGGTPAAVTGQAILSREPIADAATIVFAEQASLRWRLNPIQPRRGGRIALEATTSGVRFFNLHLESGGGDELRTRQLAEVVAASKQHGDRAVIAGDFNNDGAFQSFMFEGLGRAGFVDALGTTPRQTSINHRHPIDWMFVRGGTSTGGRVERVDDTSDHYPLVARISR